MQLAGIALTTINSFLKKWRETGVIGDLERSGRSRSTTPEQERKIISLQEEDRMKSGQ